MLRSITIAAFSILTLTATQASALPPDITNTCGGSGACMYEAQDLELWDDACTQASADVRFALQDFNACVAGCWDVECMQECASEADTYNLAIQIQADACSERDAAADALESCLAEGCFYP